MCLRDVSVSFFRGRASVTALQHLSLTIPRGEFLALLGPSGCGKSTLLRLVAGLLAPTSGQLDVLGTSPEVARDRREIGFVFQDAALLPWRTALENVVLPLEVSASGRSSGTEQIARRERARQLLDLMGLGSRLHAYPHELSGGMRQRVSIARALVTSPGILLLDEPFAALDEITRDRMNEELRRLWRETAVTILFVTHSIYEAAFLGGRVLVMGANPGRVKAAVNVPLPEDRTLAIRDTPEFNALAARLRRALEEPA